MFYLRFSLTELLFSCNLVFVSSNSVYFTLLGVNIDLNSGTGKRIDVYYATVGPLDHNTKLKRELMFIKLQLVQLIIIRYHS
uniref:Uncharacterized protein n=1 Tax=Lactuca sativa TaxID=4236 RepID=A0A9R1XJH0_LACSA|nr:hypothetical protein LSAT_V11C300129460 [Lactuca sativa]